MYRTQDQVASEFIAEGQRRGITPKGIVITIATGLVESNLTVYANPKVPESMSLPHDAEGVDSFSVGPLQQQVVGPPWWWGDAATCMNPTTSAGLFYDRLARTDYNSDRQSPGLYAADIQQPAAEYRGRYDDRMAEAWEIYNRLTNGPQEATEPLSEHILDYDHTVTPQERYWDCGPASTQVVLSGRDLVVSESDLIAQIGTTENGTDDISWVLRALNPILPGGKYTTRYMPNDPPTEVQKQLLWADIKGSIDAGYGLVANIVAPPSNYPRGVNGSTSPAYGGGTVFHYIALMGYEDTTKAVWVADPGFHPFGYFVSLDQLATLIPPKGYAYATAVPAVTQPAPPEDEFLSWVKEATDRQLMEYIVTQIGDGDPAWPSHGKTLRDKVWGL